MTDCPHRLDVVELIADDVVGSTPAPERTVSVERGTRGTVVVVRPERRSFKVEVIDDATGAPRFFFEASDSALKVISSYRYDPERDR